MHCPSAHSPLHHSTSKNKTWLHQHLPPLLLPHRWTLTSGFSAVQNPFSHSKNKGWSPQRLEPVRSCHRHRRKIEKRRERRDGTKSQDEKKGGRRLEGKLALLPMVAPTAAPGSATLCTILLLLFLGLHSNDSKVRERGGPGLLVPSSTPGLGWCYVNLH